MKYVSSKKVKSEKNKSHQREKKYKKLLKNIVKKIEEYRGWKVNNILEPQKWGKE